MREPKKRARSTSLVAHPYEPPAGFVGVQPPVHKASTVVFANMAAVRARSWKEKVGYTYGLHGTPTSFILEERIATLEGGRHTLLVPSGLAAITTVDMALLGHGDEVLIPENAYGPGVEFARQELARWGVSHRLYDPLDASSLEQSIGERTRLLWLEAPGSVTMEFPDLPALVAIAKRRGVTTALDNTWGAGIAFCPFDLRGGDDDESVAVDISVQALTKYPSGGGDVLMGSITTRDDALHQRIKMTHMRVGFGVGANDVELVLRSLPSLPVRYAAQAEAGRALAAWWAARPEVAHVLHPALATSPGHAHWARACSDAAGLFSVVFDERYSRNEVDRFVDALKLFRIGYSWAGPVSLAVAYDPQAMRPRSRWRGFVVRFSLGLEDVDDLIADCEQALGALSRA